MIALTPLIGYLVGSLPTANGIARVWGVDLRSTGSGNPGANNARRMGGLPLAVLVLLVEFGKGVLAAFLGFQLGGDPGAVLAGLGAIGGNTYNVWYRFGGGKGLGISGGVILAVWPTALPIILIFLALMTISLKSSGKATLATIGFSVAMATIWTIFGWPNAWGVENPTNLIMLTIGFVLILSPKQIHDARHPIEAS